MYPAAPAFGLLRLATFADLPRLGVVGASGFYHSSFWDYERSFASRFPNDKLASYMKAWRDVIVDEKQILLVVEDELDRNEVTKVDGALAAIYPSFEDQIPADSLHEGRAIVGVACLQLEEGSKRVGQFQPEGPNPKISEIIARGRDQSSKSGPLMHKYLHPREEEMKPDMNVVHPAYWRRGHGSRMVKWMLELASTDRVGMGVTASSMGREVFLSLGFKRVELVMIPGYDAHPEPLEAWLGIRDESSGLKTQ